MTFIVTASGAQVDFLNPTIDQINISDIAHALAVVPRFAGHTYWKDDGRVYTVAQHSILVSNLIGLIGGSVYEQMWGLLHDASEAYMGDCSSPLKRLLPAFQSIESRLQAVICDRFGLAHSRPESVHWADKYAICIEARDLHHPTLAKILPVVEHSALNGMRVDVETFTYAHDNFLRIFHYLRSRLTQ